jgi:hypothetical protein
MKETKKTRNLRMCQNDMNVFLNIILIKLYFQKTKYQFGQLFSDYVSHKQYRSKWQKIIFCANFKIDWLLINFSTWLIHKVHNESISYPSTNFKHFKMLRIKNKRGKS